MINLYYDNINHGNGYSTNNCPVREIINITKDLTLLGIPYSIHKLDNDTVINESELNLYVIELLYGDRISNIFENIPKSTYDLLKEKLKLLVYFPIEGFDLKLYDNWFHKLHVGFIEKDISCKKYFIFNNLVIEDHYKKYIEEYNIPTQYRFNKVFGLPYFQFEYYNTLKAQIATGIEQINPTLNFDDVEKDFLCVNSKIRAHRLLVISEFQRRKIINNGFVSMIGSTYDCPDTSLAFARATLIDHLQKNEHLSSDIFDHVINYVDNWKELILDTNAENLNDRYLNTTYYKNSFFSVVSETGMGHYLRVTEKPYRAIVNYHPFIIIGCHGTLKYLKSLGFETFPEMFDESYDEEVNVPKRLMMVIDAVEKFTKLSLQEKRDIRKKVYEKTIHNRNLFFDKVSKQVENYFRDIFTKSINND